MPYPERLDPYEVLAHLHQLGYNNITAQQLKDFIHDLKKLIKYDMRHNEEHEKENAPNFQESSFTSCSSKSSAGKTKVNCPDKFSPSSSNDGSHISASCTSLTDTSSTSGDSESKSYTCYTRPSRGKKVVKSVDEQTTTSKRPTSSFIRPWRLHPSHTTGQGFTGTHPQKTDPVALYHRYKELWNQQKAPGEDGHSQLRWTIREKMLGQDPNPRPMSRASSTESRKRPHRF